jgi:hypothetical protein
MFICSSLSSMLLAQFVSNNSIATFSSTKFVQHFATKDGPVICQGGTFLAL